MNTSLRFAAHQEFQRAAMIMVGAGAVAGLAAHTLSLGHASPWTLGLVTGVAMLAAMAANDRTRVWKIAVRAGLAGLAGVLVALLSSWSGTPWMWAASALGCASALAWGLRGPRAFMTVSFGIGIGIVAWHTFVSFAVAHELSRAPAWLAACVAGGAFGIVSILALVPRHVQIERDRIGAEHARLERMLTGEARELVARGHALWVEASARWRGDRASRDALREAVLRLFTVARQWHAVEEAGAHITAAALVARMEALDARIAGTEDEVARARYVRARSTLGEQLRDLEEIDLSRERVLAQMHGYLAAMERLHVAAIRLASTDASRDAAHVQPVLEDLAALGTDMDACSEALIEAESIAAGVMAPRPASD